MSLLFLFLSINSNTEDSKPVDSVDPDPLTHTAEIIDPPTLEIGRAIVLGAVFGETGIESGSLSYLVDYEIASSPYYLVGWIGFSLVPVVGAVADARDAVQALINGDELGAALNAAGAFSGVGDAVKVGGAVGLFITKYPDKGGDVAKALGKYAFPHAPDLVKLKVLDIIFDGAATRLVNKHGNEILPDLVTLADKDVDLSKVIGVAKNGNDIRWLENGDDLRGWVHIDGRHIEGTLKEGLYTTFFPVGQTISRNGVPRTLSSVMDKKDVEDLICEAVKRGNIDPNDPYAYIFKPSDNGFNYGIDEMRVIFDSKGNIKTAYPIKGSNVWAWDPDIGGWINVI
ncbi:hypothetical protein [Methanolobus psychrotolerans]|uniref:hypothetical protein n=1 Tax=Methanolobus psychrotolerans TaxID=1874706 RepID=UPI0013EDC4D4|nr:hypothetical protein [Methanolobus psychrotolerans]